MMRRLWMGACRTRPEIRTTSHLREFLVGRFSWFRTGVAGANRTIRAMAAISFLVTSCMTAISVIGVAADVPSADPGKKPATASKTDDTPIDTSGQKAAQDAVRQEVLLWVKSEEDAQQAQKQITQAKALAQKLAGDDKLLPVRLLLSKAEHFAARNLPAKRDLATAAEQELKRLADTTTPAGSLHYSFLMAELFGLRDDLPQAVRTLEECLQRYYPDLLKRPRVRPEAMPEPARLALQRLGGLYQAEAERALEPADKQRLLALAAGCSVSAACGYYDAKAGKALPIPEELLAQLALCRDALQLLGKRLDLPPFLRDQIPADSGTLIERTMLQGNYKTALRLIARERPSLSMDCRRLECLAQLGLKEQTLTSAQAFAANYKAAPEFIEALLKAAAVFEQNGARDTSLQLRCQFARLLPADPRSSQYLMQYAQLLHAGNRPEEAVQVYAEAARTYRADAKIAPVCLILAAQILAAEKQYPAAITRVDEAEALAYPPERVDDALRETLRNGSLLAAKCALQRALRDGASAEETRTQATNAEKRLNALLLEVPAAAAVYPQIALLAAHAAERAGLPEPALRHFERLAALSGVPESAKSSCAARLLPMLSTYKRPDLLPQLAERIMRNQLSNRVELTLACASELLQSGQEKAASALCLTLAERDDLNVSGVLALVALFENDKLAAFRDTLPPAKLKLLEAYLPRLKEQPTYSKLLYNAAVTAAALGQKEQALRYVEEGLAQKQVYLHAESKLLRAGLCRALGNPELAEAECREILAAADRPAMAMQAVLLLAQVYHDQKKWKEVAATASFCLPLLSTPDKHLPQVCQCLELYCEALQKLGEANKTRDSMQAYLQAFPDGAKAAVYSQALKPQP